MFVLEKAIFLALYYFLETVDFHDKKTMGLIQDGVGRAKKGTWVWKMVEGVRKHDHVDLLKISGEQINRLGCEESLNRGDTFGFSHLAQR